jgi:hypothetical protein
MPTSDMEVAANQLRLEDFDLDLEERRVTHRPSHIVVSFYEYTNEDDWRRSDSATLRDNPAWRGDRSELAGAAKAAAVAKGMTAQKPKHH